MISLILGWFGTTIGRWVIIGGGVFAFFGAFAWHQQSVGARKATTKIIKKSNKAAKKRNAQIRKIGDRIDARTAMQRLRDEFPDTDSN